ncbi:hypothetical protein DFJ73DRAFT_828209 [Zopfochytrium polystomum]|nr:hypothetical protein DFJ73DRAFT_828209 [Zopfochytrium polystomum]
MDLLPPIAAEVGVRVGVGVLAAVLFHLLLFLRHYNIRGRQLLGSIDCVVVRDLRSRLPTLVPRIRSLDRVILRLLRLHSRLLRQHHSTVFHTHLLTLHPFHLPLPLPLLVLLPRNPLPPRPPLHLLLQHPRPPLHLRNQLPPPPPHRRAPAARHPVQRQLQPRQPLLRGQVRAAAWR